jgi:tetratricopeptide (TPR) repeat protein
MNFRRLLPALVAASLLLPATVEAQVLWSWPERAENLQVLPEAIGGERLRPIMTGFTRSLGVRCSYCHVGEEGQPLGSYDFVSDANPNKDRAREMMRMVQDIRAHLAKIDPSGGEAVSVGCDTCHRGTARPMRLTDALLESWSSGGADAALARYHELRDRYYGRGAYDFGERSLNSLGYTLLEKGDTDGAIAVFSTNAEIFPDSANAFDSLAEAHLKAGHVELASEFYRKSLDLDPGNENAAKMLQQIEHE